MLFRPADLAGPSDTPRGGLAGGGGGTLGSLARRVCFVLTGGKWGPVGSLDHPAANAVLSQYVDERRGESACFVAPHIVDPWEVSPPLPETGRADHELPRVMDRG
jgi:hypothetical protein